MADTSLVHAYARARPFGLRLLGIDAPRRSERLARVVLAAMLLGSMAIVIADFIVAPLTGTFSGWFEDFGPILYAGHAANTGQDIYGAFVPNAQSSLVTDLGFDYLPLIAWLARPLAAMPHDVAVVLWIWITLAATIAGAVITARAVLPEAWPAARIGFCAAVLFQPAIYNVWHGQMNALVFLCLALALRAWLRGDEIACGIALGVGAACKVSPAILVLLLLRRGWWRGALASASTVAASLFAGGVLVGFDRVREWFTQVLPVLSRNDGWYFNQSWNAVVSRLADNSVSRPGPSSAPLHLLVVILSGAGILAVAWFVRPGQASLDRRSLEFAAGVLAMVLGATVSWYSAYIHLTLVLLVVGGIAARRALDRPTLLAGASALVILGVATPIFLGAAGKEWVVSTHGTPMWWPALQLVSLPALSAGALLVVLVRRLGTDTLDARPAPHLVAA